MLLGGLVTLANLLLSLVVGLRLLAAGVPQRRLPELTLAGYFLTTPILGTICLGSAYGGFADPRLALAPATGGLLVGIATFSMALGAVAICVFTWRTFRPDLPQARNAALAGSALALGGFALEGLYDGFAVSLDPGLGHWVAWLGRTAPMLWLALESFHYHDLLRRRLRLGLVDPLVADRFLLWGVWSTANLLNLAADVLSRLVFAVAGGPGHPHVADLLRSIAIGTMSATMVLGLVSGATLFLTFFPTARYRRRVIARAARAAA